MGEQGQCKNCGGLILAGALGGLCPRCLMDVALATDDGSSRTVTMVAASSEPGKESGAPTVIARYKIIRLIGEGGMGAVYEAEQEHPRRTVALKVIKPGMASPALLRRFELEAEALGRLQHPGIAQIYEAGTADTGFGPQPYFAMELIRGVSLWEYARKHDLSTRQRVEIMANVCDAVQHAHQKGLIHRDLKPGNILVDETGQPKIVDFGVARITDRDAQATSQTDAGQLIGTLAYMSPEQVLADPLELDTRSDVYTLGVILYELLSSRLPYVIGHKLHEALNAIRESDPQTLSSIDAAYRGDLETIAAKALEKDKSRRYASAAELGADLRRYLTDEPILARPPSLAYQVTKFARRHTAVVAAVAAVFIVLAGGIVASTLEASRANRERDRATTAERQATQALDRAVIAERRVTGERDRAISAESQADQQRDAAQQQRDRAIAEKQRADNETKITAAVSAFWQSNLVEQAAAPEASSATAEGGPRLALERAAAKISGKYPGQPLVEAAVHENVAQAFSNLGVSSNAAFHLEQALELRRGVSPDDLTTARIMRLLVPHYLNLRKDPEAERTALAAYTIFKARLGETHEETLGMIIGVVSVYRAQNKRDDGVTWLKKALAVSARAGRSPAQTASLRKSLEEAEENGGIWRNVSRGAFITSPSVRNNESRLAELSRQIAELSTQKRFAEAEKLAAEAVELARDGSDLGALVIALSRLAFAYRNQEKYADAERIFRQEVEILRRSGADAVRLLPALNNLAVSQRRQGKDAEWVSTARTLIELPGLPQDTVLRNQMMGLVNFYFDRGAYADAEPLLEKLVEIERSQPGFEQAMIRNDKGLLTVVLALQREFTRAEEVLQQLLTAQRDDGDPYLRLTIWTLGWVRLQSGRPVGAESLFREALPLIETVSPDSYEMFLVRSLLGLSLAAQRKYADAEPLLLSGYEGMRQRPVVTAMPRYLFTLQDAKESIGRFYLDWGQGDKAQAWQSSK